MKHYTQGFPRASGDEPDQTGLRRAAGRVFPARAGMSPNFPWDQYMGLGFPRASGDEPWILRMIRQGFLFSPRERG